MNPPPAHDEKSPNCSFVKADFHKDWSFAKSDAGDGVDQQFDFVYMRMLMAAVHDWPALFAKARTQLKQGGFLEVFEGLMEMNADDGSTAATSAAIRWFELAQKYLAAHGMKWDVARQMPQQLREAGFRVMDDEAIKMRLYPDEADPEADRGWVAAQYAKDMADIVTSMTRRMREDASSKMAVEEWNTLEHAAKKELIEEGKARGFYTTLSVRPSLHIMKLKSN